MRTDATGETDRLVLDVVVRENTRGETFSDFETLFREQFGACYDDVECTVREGSAVSSGDDRPTDSDGYTTRILCEPRDRDRFEEWAAASGFPGDVWELVAPDGEVVERYVFGENGDSGGDGT